MLDVSLAGINKSSIPKARCLNCGALGYGCGVQDSE